MLGGVAEVVSSNPRWAIKYFSAFTGIVDLLYLSIYIYISASYTCYNAGNCGSNGQCICPSGYTGKFCEKGEHFCLIILTLQAKKKMKIFEFSL